MNLKSFILLRNYKELIVKTGLMLLGLLMFSYYIWLRFIRTRVPKVIPFESFSFYSFCVIIYIILIYSYIIYILIKQNQEENPVVTKMVELFYKPLDHLDDFIRSLIKRPYKITLIKLVYWLHPYIIDSQVFYYCIAIIPRTILVITLCLDTFYFHYLANIYKILLLGFFLFLRRYFKYTLKKAKKAFIEELHPFVYISVNQEHGQTIVMEREDFSYDNEAYEHIFMDGRINVELEEYVEHYVDCYFLLGRKCKGWVCKSSWMTIEKGYCVLQDHLGNPILDEKGEEIHLPWPKKFTDEELEKRVENILQISLILKYYQVTHNEDIEVKRIKILIFSNYLLCWLYILITSVPNLRYFPEVLTIMQEIIEPFSQLWISY